MTKLRTFITFLIFIGLIGANIAYGINWTYDENCLQQNHKNQELLLLVNENNEIKNSRSEENEKGSNRDSWVDTFDNDYRIETQENVILNKGDVELSSSELFLITSTSDFDSGTKIDTETNTDWHEVPENELRLFKTNNFSDSFDGTDGQNIEVYDPFWIETITDGTTINIDTSYKNSGTASVKWNADDNILGGDSIIERTLKDFADEEISLYFRIHTTVGAPDTYAIKTIDDNGNTYSHFVLGGSGDHWEFRYYDGTTLMYTGQKYAENTWYKVRIALDTAMGTWDAWVDGGIYNDDKLVNGANRMDSGINAITKLLLKRHNGWSGQHSENWIDDVAIGSGSNYLTSGSWQSTPQNLPVDKLLKNTTIIFSGLAPGLVKIDKIEWLIDDIVNAAYDTDIENDALSPFTIAESDLTYGSFNNIDSDFTIKFYLNSDGSTTPIIKQIRGYALETKGNLTSVPVTVTTNNNWKSLTLNKTEPTNSNLTITIFDAGTNQPISGYSELNATSIDLTSINPKQYSTLKITATFFTNSLYSPILHEWAISWNPDSPKLISNIPSDWEFPEDADADNLIDLEDYFEDVWTSNNNLQFQLVSESDNTHIDATVDGKYLDFTTPTINWSGYENFKVKCTDEGGLSITSNEFIVTATEVNDPPTWTPIVYIHILEDSQLVEIVDLDKNITDCDDILENISYNLISNNNEANLFAQVVNRKVFAEPLIENYVGSAIIKISADDGYAIANISFVVIVDPVNDKPIVELLSPGNNMIITTSTVKLSWSEGFDVDSPIFSYDVYLDEVSPPQSLVSNDQTVMSFTIQLEDGTYYWSVIPYDGIEEGDWDEEKIWAFTIITEPDEIPTPPPTITLGTPYDNSIINTDNVELVWNVNNSFSDLKYLVYFDTWPKPNKLIASDITEPELIISDLTDGVTYYWTVIPVSGSLMGTCTDKVWSFTVQLDFIPEYGITITGIEWLTLNQSESRFINLTVTNEGNVKDIYMPELDPGRLGNNNVRFYDSRNILLDPNDSTLLQIVVTIPKGTPSGFYNVSVNISSFWGGNDIEATHIIQLKIMPEKTDEPEPIDHEESGNYYLYWLILIIIIILILIVIAVISRKRKRKLEEVLAEKGIVQPGTKERVLLPDIVSSKGVAPQLGAATGTPGTITPILSPAVVSQAGQTTIPQIVQPTPIPQLPQVQPSPVSKPSVTAQPPQVQVKPDKEIPLEMKLKLLNERLLKGEIDQDLYKKLRREFELTSKVYVPQTQPKLPPATQPQPTVESPKISIPQPSLTTQKTTSSPMIIPKPRKTCPKCNSVMNISNDGSLSCTKCEYKELR